MRCGVSCMSHIPCFQTSTSIEADWDELWSLFCVTHFMFANNHYHLGWFGMRCGVPFVSHISCLPASTSIKADLEWVMESLLCHTSHWGRVPLICSGVVSGFTRVVFPSFTRVLFPHFRGCCFLIFVGVAPSFSHGCCSPHFLGCPPPSFSRVLSLIFAGVVPSF